LSVHLGDLVRYGGSSGSGRNARLDNGGGLRHDRGQSMLDGLGLRFSSVQPHFIGNDEKPHLVHDLSADPDRGNSRRDDLSINLGDLVRYSRGSSRSLGLGGGLDIGRGRGNGGALGMLDSLSL
jgi:hypothetical protein